MIYTLKKESEKNIAYTCIIVDHYKFFVCTAMVCAFFPNSVEFA